MLCQLISATGSIVLVTIGGILGTRFASDPTLATLPVSAMVVGVAAMAAPAALLMKRIGRRRGFMLASASSIIAMLVLTLSLYVKSFELLVAGSAMYGINMAFSQQYRFAATESVDARFVGRAISVVLIGAIGGALLGPTVLRVGADLIADAAYAGAFSVLALMFVVQVALHGFLGPLRAEDAVPSTIPERNLAAIVQQPVFVVAVLCGTAAYGVMSFLMTATPISMHVHDGFSLSDTSRVISHHVVAMYLPSLVSGMLLDRFGKASIMAIGVLALLAASVVAALDNTYLHYASALILLGAGWNFLYVGATAMVSLTFRDSERHKAQAVNEFVVFGASAAASLFAGIAVVVFDWVTVALLPLPILLTALAGLYIVRRDPLLRQRALPAT